MPTFALSEEQEAIRAHAHSFAANSIRPLAAQLDRSGEYPAEIVREAWAAGLSWGFVPKELGGVGLSLFDQCLIDEEISWGCLGMWTSIMLPMHLGYTPIIRFGNDSQRQRWITPLSGELQMACFCLSEPSGGSDAFEHQTQAVRDGDAYVLNGAKQWITNSGHADLYVVFARLADTPPPRNQIALVVERGTPGLSVGSPEDKLGVRCSDTRAVFLEDCRVPVGHRLGAEGDGGRIARRSLLEGRPKVAAAATGLARAALEHASAYALERKVGGKPIATRQLIQAKLADMVRHVTASRLLVWNACWHLDNGKPAELESSMAKYAAADAAVQVATEAVQIFGANGCTTDYPVAKLYRDAKLTQIGEGTNEIQQLIIASQWIAQTIREQSRRR
ncbi:MAG: acyl-CoA dehydrogenase family protein [Haliangiales bacterium]